MATCFILHVYRWFFHLSKSVGYSHVVLDNVSLNSSLNVGHGENSKWDYFIMLQWHPQPQPPLPSPHTHIYLGCSIQLSHLILTLIQLSLSYPFNRAIHHTSIQWRPSLSWSLSSQEWQLAEHYATDSVVNQFTISHGLSTAKGYICRYAKVGHLHW